jgi:hypothetical protein
MINVKIELLAFDEEERFREIQFKDENFTLEDIFIQGQSHGGPNRDLPSASAGDVIHLNGKLILISKIGFKEIDQEQYEKYKNIPRRDRTFYKFDS